MPKTCDTLTFDQWMQEIDIYLANNLGVSSADLPDHCFRDAYEEGEDAIDVAEEMLEGAF